MKNLTFLCIVVVALSAGAAHAQSSTSFVLDEHAFNAGGHPEAGAEPASTSFKISLHSIGEPISARGLSSSSYVMDTCFSAAYPPPGEVTNLMFADVDTLEWDPEKSVGVYNLYRDLVSNLAGLGFGMCEQPDLTAATTDDTDLVPLDDGYFYLVTAENRLDEEGTKGFRSSGAERGNAAACP